MDEERLRTLMYREEASRATFDADMQRLERILEQLEISREGFRAESQERRARLQPFLGGEQQA